MDPQLPDPRAGRKLFPALRRPSFIAKSAAPPPPTPPEPPTPQRTTQKFFISTTYSTIAARALSFCGHVLSGVTPLQLAKNGFHYQPFSGGGQACCFACQSAKRLDSFQRLPFQEIQQLHRADCIWKVISSDLKQHLDSTDTLPSSTDIPPPPHQSAPSPFLSSKSEQLKKTTTDASTQTQSKPAQTVLPAAEEYPNDPHAHPPSTLTDPSLLPPTTLSPQPHHLTPTITTLPLGHQPTYTSALQHPTTTSPQPTLRPREPVPPTRPILTIEDRHRRFYKKPSPFHLESKTRKRSASQIRNKPVSARKSLSKLMTSALPAFSRFLAEMQPNPKTRRSHSQIHYSRAMRAS